MKENPLPLPPATVTAPLIQPPPRRIHIAARRICAVLCALSCLFFLSIQLTAALTVLSRTDLSRAALNLSQSAFLGGARWNLTEQTTADTPDFPAAQPDTSDAPAIESAPETAENEKNPAPETEAEIRYPIVQTDLSCAIDTLPLHNETSYSPDTAALACADLPFPTLDEHRRTYGTGAPYVLILHTHATESFAPEGADSYTQTDAFRSTDPAENVVAVGAVLAETLRAAGIPTIHCTEQFDAASYQSSYTRAAEAIRAYLAAYPSIQIVLDVHRDSIIRTDKTKLQPVSASGAAQVMLVVGTDDKGADFPNWEENLTFALHLQAALGEEDSTIARAINLRGAAFNEQYRPGSLLVEIGSCGNTLHQAKSAAETAAKALISLVGASAEQKLVRLAEVGEDQIRLLRE